MTLNLAIIVMVVKVIIWGYNLKRIKKLLIKYN